MLNCEVSQSLMADALYDDEHELTPDSRLQEHLKACSECSALYAELCAARESLLGLGIHSGSFDDIPERAALSELWPKLEPGLNQVDAERYHQLARSRVAPWAAAITAIAAAVLLFIGILPSTPVVQPQPSAVATTTISPELMNYLERAQVMLVQVANTESNDGLGIPMSRDFARNLATEANLLTVEDDSSFSSTQRKLLRDIEFLLLQVANLDESNMVEGVALLQRYLEENSILFKIRLMEMRDQDRELII